MSHQSVLCLVMENPGWTSNASVLPWARSSGIPITLFGASFPPCLMNDAVIWGKLETAVQQSTLTLKGIEGDGGLVLKVRTCKYPGDRSTLFENVSWCPLHDFPVSPGFAFLLPIPSGHGWSIPRVWTGFLCP